MRPSLLLAFLLAVLVIVSLLESCFMFAEVCPDVAAERLDLVPDRLSETGLFDDVTNETLSAGVREFKPQFELESDGADKRRWVFLPDDDVIETSNPDAWRFPVGTTFWKEFSKDGVKIETRILTKVDDGPADYFDGWVAQSYVWNEDGTDALASPSGVVDAKGTTHDVPPTSQCIGCHNGTGSRVLGFSAVQLAFDSELLDLADLRAENRLSDDVNVSFPGDDLDRRALGYLHANCAHCHNAQRPEPAAGYRCFDPQNPFDFALSTSFASVDDAPLIRDFGDTELVKREDNGDSALVLLMQIEEMPALGSEEPDEEGIALLREWLARF